MRWLNGFVSVVCFSIAAPCFGAINDVFPSDYVALPEETSMTYKPEPGEVFTAASATGRKTLRKVSNVSNAEAEP